MKKKYFVLKKQHFISSVVNSILALFVMIVSLIMAYHSGKEINDATITLTSIFVCFYNVGNALGCIADEKERMENKGGLK